MWMNERESRVYGSTEFELLAGRKLTSAIFRSFFSAPTVRSLWYRSRLSFRSRQVAVMNAKRSGGRVEHPAADNLELSRVMYALSDPTRLEIVRELAAARGSGMCCSALLGDRPKSSMSHHFKILRQSGVIETRTEGKEHVNRLRKAELESRFPGLLRSVTRALAEPAPRSRSRS